MITDALGKGFREFFFRGVNKLLQASPNLSGLNHKEWATKALKEIDRPDWGARFMGTSAQSYFITIFRPIWYGLIEEMERNAGLSVEGVSHGLSADEFFARIRGGVIVHDKFFQRSGGVGKDHPAVVHRLQMYLLMNEWLKEKGFLQQGNCDNLTYDKPTCAKHLYQILAPIFYDPSNPSFQHEGKRFNLLQTFNDEALKNTDTGESCCNRSLKSDSVASNLWSVLFDVPLRGLGSPYGFWAPYFYSYIPEYVASFKGILIPSYR